MQNLPGVVMLPFKDGAREVAEAIATLMKQYKIPTHELTYEQAVDRMNWHNADKAVKDQFQKIQDDHLRTFGT